MLVQDRKPDCCRCMHAWSSAVHTLQSPHHIACCVARVRRYLGFFVSMFDLAEAWVNGADPDRFARFLTVLLHRLRHQPSHLHQASTRRSGAPMKHPAALSHVRSTRFAREAEAAALAAQDRARAARRAGHHDDRSQYMLHASDGSPSRHTRVTAAASPGGAAVPPALLSPAPGSAMNIHPSLSPARGAPHHSGGPGVPRASPPPIDAAWLPDAPAAAAAAAGAAGAAGSRSHTRHGSTHRTAAGATARTVLLQSAGLHRPGSRGSMKDTGGSPSPAPAAVGTVAPMSGGGDSFGAPISVGDATPSRWSVRQDGQHSVPGGVGESGHSGWTPTESAATDLLRLSLLGTSVLRGSFGGDMGQAGGGAPATSHLPLEVLKADSPVYVGAKPVQHRPGTGQQFSEHLRSAIHSPAGSPSASAGGHTPAKPRPSPASASAASPASPASPARCGEASQISSPVQPPFHDAGAQVRGGWQVGCVPPSQKHGEVTVVLLVLLGCAWRCAVIPFPSRER